MKKYGIVYKVTNLVNNKMYIGITTYSLSKRWSQHCNDEKSLYALNTTIRKYGKESFKVEEIYSSFSKEDLCEKEVYFIKLYNTLAPNGYNMTTGGEHFLHNELTKKLISEKGKGRKVHNKGVPMSLEARQHLSKVRTGHLHTEETKQKMSESKKGKKPNNYGKKMSIETRLKISEQLKNRIITDETKLKLAQINKLSKSIYCNENGKTYVSMTQAANDLKISRKTIKKALDNGGDIMCKYTFSLINKENN
jgi:group I intron endonuclease